MSTVAKLILGAALGAMAVSALTRLVATRNRNAAPTPIRYTAPFRSLAPALIAEPQSTLPATTNATFGWVVVSRTEY